MRDPNDAPRDVSAPEAGFFELRLVRGGPRVPARITFHHGVWGASINGEPCGGVHHDPAYADGVFRVWLGGRRVTQAEYEYRISLRTWAVENDHTHPAANPTKVIDLRTHEPLF